MKRLRAAHQPDFEPQLTGATLSLHADQNLMGDLEALNKLWNPPPSPYLNNPTLWMDQVAKQETWSKQREVMQSVNDNRYTAVKSCHGPGKSWTGAWAVAWWLSVKIDPFVVTSAPTSHQVRTILWREIRRAKTKLRMPGHISQGQVPEWKIAEELVAFGRKPADYKDPQEAANAFQGVHALHTLVVLDEGSGIPQWLADACENLITNEFSRLLIIGNPDNPVSYFSRAFKPGSDFNKITISAFDTPAFTGEPVSENLLQRLTSKIWVNERRKRWTENSPLWQSKVLGEFPTITDDTVFTPAMIEAAILNDRTHLQYAAEPRYGFDVARLGPDESVVYLNQSGKCRLVKKWAKRDTMQSVTEYRELADKTAEHPTHTIPVVIDMNGLGAGPYDRLKELHYPVTGFNGGARAYNPLKYANRRAEAYWTTRQLFEDGLIDLEQEDEDLQAELLEVHFKVDSAGRIQIEKKEDISDRLGRSPDRADAFVMSLQREASIQDFIDRNRQQPTEHPADQRTNYASDQHDPESDLQIDQTEAQDLVGDLPNIQF